ncbi:MAG: nicotinamidase [Bacillota bacterium]
MEALLVVDLQNDFCPGGALAVPGGDRIVPVVNELLEQFELVVASKDWHPADTVHFESWPEHCLQQSEGAEFHPALEDKKIDKVFYKGTKDKDDGYSAFEATNLDLENYLRERNVATLFITGLALEYCVKETALAAASRGFEVYLVEDATAGIDKGDIQIAVSEMKEAGVKLVSSREILGYN